MACMVETYNPQTEKFFGGASGLLYHESFEDEESRVMQLLAIPPSALHSQSTREDVDMEGVRDPYFYESTVNGLHQQQKGEGMIPAVQQSYESGLGSREVSAPSIVDEVVKAQRGIIHPPWWETELAVNIHQTLREREKKLAPIQFRSPQLKHRQYLVDFLHMVSKQLLLSHGTRFLAVSLMDRFMDRHIVMKYRLKLVALTSLLIAAKFEDKDDQIPTVEQMRYFARLGDPDHYTREEFHKMELYMLRFFDWGISHPTPAHYADYYLTHGDGLDEGDPSTSPAAKTPEGLRDPVARKVYMEMCNTYFIEAALKDYTFLQYAPSLVAAAAICASRICVGIPTAWSRELEVTTGYHLPELSTVVEHMLRIHEQYCR